MGAFYSSPRRARNLLNGPRRRARDFFKGPRRPREFISSSVRYNVSYVYTHSFSRLPPRAATKYKGESNFSSNARFPTENSTLLGSNYDRPTTPLPTPTPTPTPFLLGSADIYAAINRGTFEKSRSSERAALEYRVLCYA